MRLTGNRDFSVHCLKYNCKYVIIWIINISMQGAYNTMGRTETDWEAVSQPDW